MLGSDGRRKTITSPRFGSPVSMNLVSVTGRRSQYAYFLTKMKSPCTRVGIIEPDGIRNGSKMKERITRTNNSTGKKDREYSTRTSLAPGACRESASSVFQTSLSTATTTPEISVNTVSINARLTIKIPTHYYLSICPRAARRGTPPVVSPQTQPASCVSCPPSVSRAIFACATRRRRSTWRSHFCVMP